MENAERSFRRADITEAQNRNWPVVAACALCLMLSVGTLTLYSFGVFVRPLASQFHWTRTQISFALTLGQFMVALGSPVWGFLIDRFGPRAIVLPSIAALSLAFASLALLTPHLWHLYLIFVAAPLLGGGASPVGYTAVLVRLFERRLGLALGLALTGIGLGAALVPPLSQAFVAAFGWRVAYAAIGALTLAVTLPAGIFATRHVPLPAQVEKRTKIVLLPMIFTRAFLLMCTIFILLGIVSGGALAHLIPMMSDRGLSPVAAARVAGLGGIAVIVGRGGVGWLIDRFNAARLLSGVALTIVASMLLLLYAHGDIASCLAAILLGSVLGAEVDFTAFLVRRYFGYNAFGRLYGIAFGLFALGVGIGPLLMGLSFDRLGGYHPGLLLFAGFGAIAAIASFGLPHYSSFTAAAAPPDNPL